MKKLPEKWGPLFRSKPETGMGYHTGNVSLSDGRKYEDIVFDSGFVIRVRGYAEIPFEAKEIVSIELTGRKWAYAE